MSQEPDSAAAMDEAIEIGLEAPERGSAEELLDAGAQRRARPDAPLGGARHGRGGPRPVPRHEARHRAGHRRRLLLRLPAAAPADARRPRRRSRRGWREHRRRPPVRPPRAAAGRGPRLLRRARPAVQGRDPRRPRPRRPSATARRCRRRRSTSTARSSTCARGPHVASTGKIGPFKLLGRRRARTGAATRSARCSSASTARSGRPRRSSTNTCGGARRRRSATTAGSASSSTCSASTTSRPGSAFWHPKGQMIWRTLEGAMRELQARRGYQEISTPILVDREAVAAVGPLGPLRRRTCSIVESEDQTLQPQADELPRSRRSSTARSCARTATCRCASTSTAGSTATSGPAR